MRAVVNTGGDPNAHAHGWNIHSHPPNDPLASQHGPNLHTHDATGKVDTVLGKRVDGRGCLNCGSWCGYEGCVVCEKDKLCIKCERGY